jgi:hypothetical protein
MLNATAKNASDTMINKIAVTTAEVAARQDNVYVVRVRQGHFVLRIGQVSPELQALHAGTRKDGRL